MSEAEKFDSWAILELMGHRKLAGRVSEATLAGGAFVRIDVPSGCTGDAASWCPVHGDCSCSLEQRGAHEVDDACPLHRRTSEHSEAPIATQFYSPAAVFCVTPCSEDLARRVAQQTRPQPVTLWELPERTGPDLDEDRPF